MTGNSRRGSVAPAELLRLLSLPDDCREIELHAKGIKLKPKKQKAERTRLLKLCDRLYGPTAIKFPANGKLIKIDADLANEDGFKLGGHRHGECCSHDWADVAWKQGGSTPRMRPCNRCGTPTPANCLQSSGGCYECLLEGLPPARVNPLNGLSASVLDVHHLRGRR